jgi:hypothetical protein
MPAKRSGEPTTDQQTPGPHEAGAHLVGRWWAVVRHPAVRTFDRQRASASWRAVWLGLALLAAVEALAVAYLAYGPERASGYSSLPVGPKLQLPPTPLFPLAALVGSVAQFFLFAALLHLSARVFGGRGAFLTHAYLLALGWVPLIALSDLVELLPALGTS